jgi:hypothetical protein
LLDLADQAREDEPMERPDGVRVQVAQHSVWLEEGGLLDPRTVFAREHLELKPRPAW